MAILTNHDEITLSKEQRTSSCRVEPNFWAFSIDANQSIVDLLACSKNFGIVIAYCGILKFACFFFFLYLSGIPP